jgi:hypothetical protein
MMQEPPAGRREPRVIAIAPDAVQGLRPAAGRTAASGEPHSTLA